MKVDKKVSSGVLTTIAASVAAHEATADGFDGFYIGASVNSFSGDVPYYYSSSSYGDYQFKDQATIGAFAGYNHVTASGAMFGFELDQFATLGAQNGYPSDYTLEGLIDVRVRAGYVLNDKTMIYGFAGVSNARGGGETAGRSYSEAGSNYGIGAEYLLTDKLGISAEYTGRKLDANYSDMDKSSATSSSVSLRAAFHF